ncbi:MAG: hypothetical protein K2J04_06915 [Lachnospiraceae bacterium]|nr:hypothetical protein [Lachnospiraceae bacterium]
MKRLLSAISVLCILFLIVRTSREYQENSAYTYAYDRMMPPIAKPETEVLESVRGLYRMRTEREEMGDWYFYSSYAKRVYARRSAYHDFEDWYGYEYTAYTYEDDYDGDGSKEAFVAIGQQTGDTTEYLFGNLYFVSDLEIQLLEEAIFIGKEPVCSEQNGKTHIYFAYKENIQPMQAVYAVTDGLAERQNPIEKNWEEKAVVGNEYTPDEDVKERMANAKDYREDDYELLRGYSCNSEMLDGIGLVNTTENFATYVVGDDGVIIETAEQKYLYADIRYTTHYMVSPKWKEADFDGDGINELAMITFVKHGTGCHINSLYITDQNEAGEWKMYEFLHEDYCRQLRKHFDTVIDGDDTWFVFDGQWIGAPELFNNEVPSYQYDVENQIEFEYTPDGIEITAEVEGIRTSDPWGINDYPDYQISAQVKHLGNGNWQLSDVRCRTWE